MIAPTVDRLAEIVAELAAEGIKVCRDCLTRLHPDGACRPCESHADPAFGAYSDAIYGGENAEDAGLPYSADQQARDARTVRRYERAMALAEEDARSAPNGCAWCGVEQRGHGTRWARVPGTHTFEAPPNALRLMRMRARRFAADCRMYLAVSQRFHSLGGPAS